MIVQHYTLLDMVLKNFKKTSLYFFFLGIKLLVVVVVDEVP